MSNFQLSIQMFLQLSIILTAIKLIGYLGKRLLGQPQVVCEMITGVLLGPSFLGYYWPEGFALFMPKESIPVIYCLAQIGLVLYMFVIGTEFSVDVVAKRLKTAVGVSVSGVATPMILALPLAIYLFDGAPYFADTVTVFQRWLFIGAAISITAFPMLARIIHECKISHTSMGSIALAAGSLDDVTAWCLLAVVVAIFSGDAVVALTAILGGIIYAVFVLGVLKYALNAIYHRSIKNGYLDEESANNKFFGLIIIILMLSAYITDRIGIYAVFGAFILGLSMPKGKLTENIQTRIEPLSVYLFLPMFFIYSGLNTKFSLVMEGAGLYALFVVMVVSIFGKFVACSTSAKLGGETTRDALCIGILMNARGLMELILLNIGYERGIITQNLYTILVIMAVVTTLMATPIFNLILDKKLLKNRDV